MIRKASAFITRDVGDRRELLVFTHRDVPQAGIQIPSGTVDDDEEFDAAVLREVWEESGLTEFAAMRVLGDEHDTTDTGKPRWRRFYHLTVAAPVPDTWSRAADGEIFEFTWVDVTTPIDLHRLFHGGWVRFLPLILSD